MIRSPGCADARPTRVSPRHCACEVRGMGCPAFAHAVEVSPEQSYDEGPTAPHTYGLPIWAMAKSTAFAAVPLAFVRPPPGSEAVHRDLAFSVCCFSNWASSRVWSLW